MKSRGRVLHFKFETAPAAEFISKYWDYRGVDKFTSNFMVLVNTEVEYNAWVSTLNQDTIDAYNIFLARFPRSRAVREAVDRRKDLMVEKRKRLMGDMQLAESDSGVQIISDLLKNKATNPKSLEEFVDYEGLRYKYPLGFAVVYSDGTQVLSYVISSDGPIRFDPSVSKTKFENTPDGKGTNVCFDRLPIRVNGRVFDNFRDICIGGVGPINHAFRLGDVSIDVEYAASSPLGKVWIIGMTP